MSEVTIKAFFDEDTYTVSYVVSDPGSGRAAVIDAVLDYDPNAGRTAHRSADKLIAYVRGAGLVVDWILETHVHADHLSGAQIVKSELGGKYAIGERVGTVQATFKKVFNLTDLAADGSQFDRLFADGDTFQIGNIKAQVMATPGHTPDCVTYVIGDCAFVGDTLFMPDYGSARTDFPGGSAAQLYTSIRKILALPGKTRLFMCHDYKAPGRDEFAWETTVKEQNERNIHISKDVSEAAFVEMRESRDSKLGSPRLILPSIQVNVNAGRLPEPDDNGIRYLRIPLDTI
ncbi:MAG TPA: MBL fold metallo-hydrolase [Woeseiaceae bacterium]|nr:MBL fold metallo-hydrolase [Woeseiaceae bacterium]